MLKQVSRIKICALGMSIALWITSIPASVQAGQIFFPAPSSLVDIGPASHPIVLKGIKIDPAQPLRLQFMCDAGNGPVSDAFNKESERLVKYFLAGLTVPQKDLWVNLSPYERDRVIPPAFGSTELGRDLLAQDYVLKQITASLIYPEGKTGRKFWEQVYAAAHKAGLSHVPVNAFHKVWIVPDKAVVYENPAAGTAYIVNSRLKVMLEEDYMARDKSQSPAGDVSASQALRDVVLPVLAEEINAGEHFAFLRQAYHSLILAAWYKKKMTQSILAQTYVDQNKVQGTETADTAITIAHVYDRYVEAFKKGVYNLIKEEPDPIRHVPVPRKYFSGGMHFGENLDQAMIIVQTMSPGQIAREGLMAIHVDMQTAGLTQAHEQWAAYIKEKKWEEYEDLLNQVPNDIQDVLMSDRSLQLVILAHLDAGRGDIKSIQLFNPGKEVAGLKGKALEQMIHEHMGYAFADIDMAKEAYERGEKIVFGITDAEINDGTGALRYIANNRQYYVPLEDGTWLGFKGTGNFGSPHNAYSFRESGDDYYGLFIASEMGHTFDVVEQGLRSDAFIEPIGFTPLHHVPEVDGSKRVDIKSIDPKMPETFILVSRALSPHRVVELPKLLKANGFNALRNQLEKVLNKRLSFGQIILRTMEQMGRAEAYKVNHGLKHKTYHEQDIILGGQIADISELVKGIWDLNYYEVQLIMKYIVDFLNEHHEELRGADEWKELYTSEEGPEIIVRIFFENFLRDLSDEKIASMHEWLLKYFMVNIGNEDLSYRLERWINAERVRRAQGRVDPAQIPALDKDLKTGGIDLRAASDTFKTDGPWDSNFLKNQEIVDALRRTPGLKPIIVRVSPISDPAAWISVNSAASIP